MTNGALSMGPICHDVLPLQQINCTINDNYNPLITGKLKFINGHGIVIRAAIDQDELARRGVGPDGEHN